MNFPKISIKGIINDFGGRRYFYTHEIFWVATFLRYKGKIREEDWVSVATVSLAIYAGVNLWQKISEAKNDK